MPRLAATPPCPRRLLLAGLAFGLTWLAAAPALAQPVGSGEPAGRIKRLTGSVRLERGGAAVAVQPGTPVFVGDRLVTGADGAVGLVLADDSLLTTGPNSTLVIERFAFDSTTHDGSLVASLLRGTLHMVTGLIARRTPEKVEVKTPTATLGVRGTEFIVETTGRSTP